MFTQCADRVPEDLAHGPIGLEGFDNLLVDYTRRKGVNLEGVALLPEGGGWLLVEFGADTQAEAEAQARVLMAALSRSPHRRTCVCSATGSTPSWLWDVRESAWALVSHVAGERIKWEGWEDSAVAPEKLGGYLRRLCAS